jgi:pilus assembly protein Flp/PilA
MKETFTRFIFDASGATAIEYALIAGGIALVIVTAIANLGGNLKNQYGNIANAIP